MGISFIKQKSDALNLIKPCDCAPAALYCTCLSRRHMRSNLFSTELEVRESLAGRSASPTSPTGFVTEQIKIAVRAGCHMVVRLSPLSSLGHQRCSSLLPPYKSPPCCEAAQCACLAHRAAGLQVVILLDVDFRPSLELSDMVYNQSKYQSLLSVVNNKFAVILPAMEAFGERDVSNLWFLRFLGTAASLCLHQ